MKVVIFLAGLVFAVSGAFILDPVLEEWEAFKLQYNKTYSNAAEERFRFKIFMERKREIEEHNARYQKGEVTFKMGVNRFSDFLLNEFIRGYLGFRKSQRNNTDINAQASTFVRPSSVHPPDEVNWVKKHYVTAVKDQLGCGASWAFSATGALEGQLKRRTTHLISLSEQNLMDCSQQQGNHGCDGGTADQAFTYVKVNMGLDAEIVYPYQGAVYNCRYSSDNSEVAITGYVDIKSGDEEALKEAVAAIGPISVAIDASLNSFMSYQGGVYSDAKCKNKIEDVSHGTLVVGYGTDNETKLDYWLLKNSWGSVWGQNGYFKLARNAGNMCGVATTASYPLL